MESISFKCIFDVLGEDSEATEALRYRVKLMIEVYDASVSKNVVKARRLKIVLSHDRDLFLYSIAKGDEVVIRVIASDLRQSLGRRTTHKAGCFELYPWYDEAILRSQPISESV